ncbi:MAG: GNAT family N-acetyltransferase [Gemmatimonadaceae bacterium]|nr:GNAT family N-acetyltransferase [Gemmatimonadaceae bacterium]
MTRQLSIRDLSAGDLLRLVPLLEELGYPVTSDALETRFAFFASKGESALVALRDERVVGLLTLHVTHVLHRPGSVGRVTTLVVAQDVQGQGIGRALMDEAERRLWARDCVLIEVTSNMKRSDAHDFYEKLGYERTSFRFGKTRAS